MPVQPLNRKQIAPNFKHTAYYAAFFQLQLYFDTVGEEKLPTKNSEEKLVKGRKQTSFWMEEQDAAETDYNHVLQSL